MIVIVVVVVSSLQISVSSVNFCFICSIVFKIRNIGVWIVIFKYTGIRFDHLYQLFVQKINCFNTTNFEGKKTCRYSKT